MSIVASNRDKIKLILMLEGASGGARKHVVDLLLGLDKNRYAITFIYSLARADALFLAQLPLLSREGIELAEVPMNRGFQGFFDLKSLLELRRIMRRLSPDIVHVHGAKAGALGRLAAWMHGVKGLVYTPHGGSFHKFGGRCGVLYGMVERSLSRAPNHIIGVSKSSCAVARKYRLAGPERIHLVHNGIDLGKIDAWLKSTADVRHEKRSESGPFIVLYPASFLETKGHLELLDALGRSRVKLDPRIQILLAGEGPLQEKISRRIHALGLHHHFHFLGFQSHLCKYYQMSDLVLLPSQAEAFGYVLLEAMAFSKPIVATRVGGIPELVLDGYNGVLIDPDRLTVLPEYLNQYLHQPSYLQTLGRNGRATVECRFTLKQMVRKTEKVYETILNGPG
ncbi:glycosyltransferase family 4 protein [Desulforhabdus sp. TSK]|uniref:glycosyltransferase family 4 protein n=1 Tax=Desulforhabdus sp. TSK TaxID=2925014 RepID=UPI001FC8293F|nr:glycosyltransferase family 4 protein [Desulforhabdus sp. TSK]GKT10734.1 glycosyl transferase [Desulforhabdus sp. TSK]